MSILSSVAMLVLGFFACAFLQLAPSVFALFCHYASGKRGFKRLLDDSSFYNLGVACSSALLIFICYISVFYFLMDNPDLSMPEFENIIIVVASILFAISVFILCFYYRKEGTSLFIPRKLAKALAYRAKVAKSRSDIFALGMATGLCEIWFKLPVYLVVCFETIKLDAPIIWQPLILIAFVIVSFASAMSIRGQFLFADLNLAEIQRTRVKLKAYHRMVLFISYALLSVALIVLRLIK